MAAQLPWRSQKVAELDSSSGCRACRLPTKVLLKGQRMGNRAPILVVDDDPAIRAFVQLALEDTGYEVIVATDGLDALEAIREREPGLILLDMRMPRMNGWEFAAAYRREWSPRAPIVIMTA